MTDNNWEKDVLEKIALEGLKEQKRSRRWGIFFKLLGFAYLFILLGVIFSSEEPSLAGLEAGKKHTAVVELNGVIAPGADASADNIINGLRRAFKNKDTAGVILRCNSPGGSPVQSGYIYDEILRLREKYPNTPLYAVISDICASGGYYVVSAAEKIYADQASIVGSIGVRMDNFGLVDAMKKLGIESRTLTSGENKALMDPFSPENPKIKQHMQGMLDAIHEQFINAVKQGRGKRLNTDVPGLFSGLIWTGDQAVEIGLVDDLASTSQVARDVIKADNIVNFSVKPDFFDRFSKRIGASVGAFLSESMLTPQLKYSPTN